MLAAAAHLKKDIRAFISSYGNTGGEQAYMNMLNLAGLLQFQNGLSFIKGSFNPLGNDNFIPTDYHGANGLCGLELSKHPDVPRVGADAPVRPSHNVMRDVELPPSLRDTPLKEGGFWAPSPRGLSSADDWGSTKHDSLKEGDTNNNPNTVQTIYELIKKHKNVKYIAIGPLTNLALLFDRFPDAADFIDELIIMGGGFDISNVENNAEYNFGADPAAVAKVLASPVKKVIAPLDMTHKLAFSREEIEDITGVKQNDLTEDMSDVFNVFAKIFYLNYATSVKNGNEGAIIHDAATVAYLIDKSKCDVQRYKITSDEYGAVKKHSPDCVSGHDVFVINDIDRDFMKGLLRECFFKLKK